MAYLIAMGVPSVEHDRSLVVREGSLVVGLVVMLVTCLVVIPVVARLADRKGAVRLLHMAQ